MKRLTTLLMTLMLMSAALWADQTVTVSANSSDISEGLDLKVVAKLFAQAKNLEEFEMMLNNPDSAFCNLDLNGDGQVDYLRVVETGEGNKRLIVLQAVLAKDIYQDVASIYVEKNEANEVSVQVVGDEYVYGTNYIIEPVYIYRPVIYDWFWSDAWYAWHSPWYWGYYPGWWYVHHCWAHDWYWHHCYAYHHHHHYCSFRPGKHAREGYHALRNSVARRDYASSHPDRSFSVRNSGMTNAREIRNASSIRSTNRTVSGGTSRTYGSSNTAFTRNANTTGTTRTMSGTSTGRTASTTSRTMSGTTTSRTAGATTATRTASASTTREAGATRSFSGSSYSSGSTSTRSMGGSSYSGGSTRSSYSGGSTSTTRSMGGSSYSSGSTSTRSSYSGGSSSGSRSSYSGGSRSTGGSSIRR